jgi:tetratricopeptide (TPR) repeat protein
LTIYDIEIPNNQTAAMKYSLMVGCTVALVIYAHPAIAQKSYEVKAIAKATSVKIKLQKNNTSGSGVIVHQQGNTYTIVTNRHVVCGSGRCSAASPGETYSLILSDGQQYRVNTTAIKMLGDDLDLAVIQFQSNRKYTVATIAEPNSLKLNSRLFTTGHPYEQTGFSFNRGNAIAVVNKRLTGDKGGYSIVYDAITLPGMSGGGVFDNSGQLVAIHGYGDRYQEGTLIDDSTAANNKIGFNRGIPVRWVIQSLSAIGLNLGSTASSVATKSNASSADERFITGFNKYIEPGNDRVVGTKQAIQELTTAIKLNPQYASAYFVRGFARSQIQDYRGAIGDYSKAIELNPKFGVAYYNLGVIKAEKINDQQGALADYNRAIEMNPEVPDIYLNRGVVKDRLKDIPGAIADHNKAIALNPQYARAYSNRAKLKFKQKDYPGSLADLDQAITLSPTAGNYYDRGVLKYAQRNYDSSLIDLNKAIALDPKFPEAYYNRAILKKRNKDQAGAVQDLREAAKLYRAQSKTRELQTAIDFLRELGATE